MSNIDIAVELDRFLAKIEEYDKTDRNGKICYIFDKKEFIDTIEEYLVQEFANSDIMEEEKREAYEEGYNEGYDEGRAETEEWMRDERET